MKTLNGAKVQQLLSKLENTLVSIGIPKMKIETNYGLKEALLKMGATDMFSSKANLSGISKEPPLQITDATHKAIIEVDEEGTTAAAATAMMAAGSAFIQEEPKEFTADHPFLFFLTKDKNPLFMGHFM
ncbi:hypothetical protein OESDEN_24512 [Oesophagostomum dentatum]|uniref:Serpin domain-containing protein n=1 Tax=Oesophagostomum dentatum TaxID=61180 RepID=A0A0B1RW53_OESDE|nr:hypothetical protein OESDEN_24512 [Oesophagostomum dentatum]